VKPVQGADGNRVPLLRPGFSPPGFLTRFLFVFIHLRALPFAKKGGSELALPQNGCFPSDSCNGRYSWPEQYKVKKLWRRRDRREPAAGPRPRIRLTRLWLPNAHPRFGASIAGVFGRIGRGR